MITGPTPPCLHLIISQLVRLGAGPGVEAK